MTVTLLFSDLMGFTALAERLPPEVFGAWLNEYLDAVTGIIKGHGGVAVRFVGDAILAGFGIPLPRASEGEIGQDRGPQRVGDSGEVERIEPGLERARITGGGYACRH